MAKTDSLQGSLDLLVLKILSRRPRLHGYAIMSAIADMSGDVLRGSLSATDEVSQLIEDLQYTRPCPAVP